MRSTRGHGGTTRLAIAGARPQDLDYAATDARGHVLRKVDGPSDLAFSYDICERLLTVTDHAASQLLKSFTYASSSTSGDWANGKLRSSTSHNRLASGPDATITETLTYGGVGGAVSEREIALSYPEPVTFTQGFTWTDLGTLEAETYPDGAGVGPERTVIYSYGNGSLTGVSQQVGSAPVSSLATLTYHPNGMVRTVAHANGVTDTIEIDADAMARPYSIATSGAVAGPVTRTQADWSTGIYDYDGVGNITHMGGDEFTYDLVSRLETSTQQVDGTKARAFDYDAFGNMKTMTLEDSSTRDFNVQAVTNRLGKGGGGGFTADYDAAGNMTSLTDDAGFNRTFTWYPTGAMQRGTFGSSRTLDHAYDADGERVFSEDSGYLGSEGGSPEAGVHVTLRGLDAKVRRELLVWDDGGTWRWQWQRDTMWRDGQILASVSSNPSAVERHCTVDHLGTPRLLTDALGVVASRHTYFPYGEEATNAYQDNGKQTNEVHRFTGHERDLVDLGATTDDLDYMHARYYSPMVGRFVSVDRGDGQAGVPQSWDRYAYSRDNPARYVDPDGRFVAIAVLLAPTILELASAAALIPPAVAAAHGNMTGSQAPPPTIAMSVATVLVGLQVTLARRVLSPEQRKAGMRELREADKQPLNRPPKEDPPKKAPPSANRFKPDQPSEETPIGQRPQDQLAPGEQTILHMTGAASAALAGQALRPGLQFISGRLVRVQVTKNPSEPPDAK